MPAEAIRHQPVPTGLADYRQWVVRAHRRHFTGVGKFNWILQTFLHLKRIGFACRLVHALPDTGIVVSHRTFLPDDCRPSPKTLLVCVLADKQEPGNVGRHPYAHIHLVQNPSDPMLAVPRDLWDAYYVPLWTQIDLVPRRAPRGRRFTRCAYFGIETNLANELKRCAWSTFVRRLRMTFSIVPRWRWHDYSNVDVVVGIRGFAGGTYHWKPATKLHNAWHAGVPAIVGPESAYQAERKNSLDYLEVRSLDETKSALVELADRPSLRERMAAHGLTRAPETSDAAIAQKWIEFIRGHASMQYERWRSASASKRSDFIRRRSAWAAAGPGRTRVS